MLRVVIDRFRTMFRLIFIGVLVMLRLTLTACPNADDVQIKAVSVDPSTNYIVISWTSNLSPYAYGYEFFETPGVGPADAVFDAGQTSFVLQREADTNLQIRIRAINRCSDGTIMPGRISENRRVFACQIEQRHCEREIRISWGDASNSIRDIAHFEIWASIDDGVFFLAGTADASLSSTTIGAFGHLQHYRIFVRAVSADPTIYANSIADTLTLVVAPEPEFAYLKTVSVINHNTVEVRTSVDVDIIWDSLFFFANNTFVGAKSYTDFAENNRLLLPRIVGASYHFQVSDTCGEIVLHSNLARPILLEHDLQETVVFLHFSEYYGWTDFGVDRNNIQYDIFEIRERDTIFIESVFGANQPSPQVFSEVDFSQIMTLRYFVVAHATSPVYGVMSSQSNVITVLERDGIPIHFPTGFVPGGYTPTYFPIFVPMPNDVMRFSIFNTFGQVVFTTTDPYHIGWDGRFNNVDVQPGIFMFRFELTRNTVTTQHRGTITVIR